MGASTKIDWCDATWNPVTGCLNDCPYCYARRIAERFGGVYLKCGDGFIELDSPHTRLDNGQINPYPYGFVPTFHRYRLDEPLQWAKPKKVFVCSMADLFGEWVPGAWISDVFEACENAPWHKYLFLTKNPKRYELLCSGHTPINWWFGWTLTGPNPYGPIKTHHATRTFISIEPLLVPLRPQSVYGVDWVIIGAETGSRKEKVYPEKEWVMEIADLCEKSHVPVFMKESLRYTVGQDFRQEWPEDLRDKA